MKIFKLNECYISIGSNIGNSLKYVKNVILHLKRNNFFYVSDQSNIHLTKALHYTFQPNFVNVIIKFYTFLSLKQLLNYAQYLEYKYYKVFNNNNKNYTRKIDIDILFFNKYNIINNKKTVIPHNRMYKRKFIKNLLFEILKN